MISEKEKKSRQHEKELNSLRNKMGKSIVWFDALNKKQQYDLLFAWKLEKFRNTQNKPQKKTLFKRVGGWSSNGGFHTTKKQIEVISYPPNFKHFLKSIKPRFSVSISKMRESQLQHLLK